MGDSVWNICIAATLLKGLLFPAYHSTDFDVHRNWLSVTRLLPLREWYVEATSPWTLDYPPFFAYFEWVLAQFVPRSVAENGCIELVPKGQYGFDTVVFQRTTVIVSEFVLFGALQWLISSSEGRSERQRNFVIACSLILSPGLFIVDHIHFQYNGFLFGVLVLSIVSAKRKRYVMCGVWFATLVCLKHIFLYIAPAYFVFLLSAYCLRRVERFPRSLREAVHVVRWWNLFKLGGSVVLVFALAFGPFVYEGSGEALLARLFPFQRGLTHAYWAPNVWALYSFADRALIKLAQKVPLLYSILGKTPEQVGANMSLTRGLVGDVAFSFLPDVTPRNTFVLTLFYQVMALVPLFVQPTYERFVGAMTLCGWSAFLFGWHVHEKAIMVVIVPMTFVVCEDRRLLAPFQLLTAAGYVSLFPLLFGTAEWLFKGLITFVWFVVFQTSLSEVVHSSRRVETRVVVLDRLNLLYMMAIAPLTIAIQLLDVFSRRFAVLRGAEFARLMVYSVYCALGIVSAWSSFSWLYFLDDSIWAAKDDEHVRG